jgi:hypothetical protein
MRMSHSVRARVRAQNLNGNGDTEYRASLAVDNIFTLWLVREARQRAQAGRRRCLIREGKCRSLLNGNLNLRARLWFTAGVFHSL